MEEIIDRRVALALRKQASEQAAAAALGPHVDVSPTQRQSSVASMEALARGSSKILKDNQRHPVDDIIGRAPCELVTPVKNKLIVVAYGVVEQPMQGQTLMVWLIVVAYGVEIPARGYAKVGVDRVVNSWDDLELEIPGDGGEKNLGEAIDGWILWPKHYIRVTQPNPPTLGSSPQGSRARSRKPSARAPSPLPNRDPSMSPVPERDPSMSPPPPPMKKRSVPPPPPKKKQKKQKEKQPKKKLPYDMTNEELMTAKQKQEPPLDMRKLRSFIRSKEAEQTKQLEKPPLSDNKADTNLTIAQLRGEDHIPTHPVPTKWKYEYGKPLVLLQLVKWLPTKMYKLHKWYMEATAQGFAMIEVQIGDEHYFHGDDIINVLLEELYFLFNQDAIDKMEIQTCWRNRYYDIGFMDPQVIHEANLRDKPNRTLKNIYKFLDKQHYKKFILLSYNFKFHWILIVVMPNMSFVYVFDSLRKKEEEYTNIIDTMNKSMGSIPSNSRGKDKLFDTEVFRAIQEQLCGFLLDEVINPAGECHNDGSNLQHRQNSGSE
uniref:DUF8039 domain-containing protein n=1 Tax=Setaria viridis TaxID=4556 RepID=A0A4U6TG79_SETVI|nr:hypothetical protein SEVIR_8G065900v2 [Setaria viridis]